MSDWTPGPWEHAYSEWDLADEEGHWFVRPLPLRAMNIATWVQNEADARLISLAPEMAELLVRISNNGMLTKTSVLDGAVSYAELDALLARARGEA